MFGNERYLTRGIDDTIPITVQLFLWQCVDRMPEPKDHLQVFRFRPAGSLQEIIHTSEEPSFHKVYMLLSTEPITEKVYIIDDGDHSTMLLSSEY